MKISDPLAIIAAAIIAALLALVTASRVDGLYLYWTFLGVFLVCVLFVFYQIARTSGSSKSKSG